MRDPRLWSSMPLSDIVALLADAGPILRYGEDSGADLVTHHGHISNEDLNQMIDEGWLYSMNGTYRLTDEGRAAYIRSTDEMGDGKLISPKDREQSQ
jgi:predicted transcriptional regulator